MHIAELLLWRKEFKQASTTSERKTAASEFKTQLNKPALKNWQVYELLRSTDFDTVARLLV